MTGPVFLFYVSYYVESAKQYLKAANEELKKIVKELNLQKITLEEEEEN